MVAVGFVFGFGFGFGGAVVGGEGGGEGEGDVGEGVRGDVGEEVKCMVCPNGLISGTFGIGARKDRRAVWCICGSEANRRGGGRCCTSILGMWISGFGEEFWVWGGTYWWRGHGMVFEVVCELWFCEAG